MTKILSGVIRALATSIPSSAVTDTHNFLLMLMRILSVQSLVLPSLFKMVLALAENELKLTCCARIALSLLSKSFFFGFVKEADGRAATICFLPYSLL